MRKITLHIQKIPDWFGEFVARCDGKLGNLVGVNTFPVAPATLLGRTHLPDGESNALVDQGAAGADLWIQRFWEVYISNPQVAYWIGPNEYILWSQEHVDRFNAFHVRYIQRMGQLGFKVACGQINTGWPHLRKYGDPPPYPESLAPMLAALWAHGGLFTTHEYAPGNYREAVGNVLRCVDIRAELIAAGITNLPDFFISETGIDQETSDPGSDYNHWGWRHILEEDWPAYFDQLKWYDAELQKLPWVVGASIFTVADDWTTFQINREEAMDLADWIAEGETEPQPEARARGIDLSQFSGEVNWPLVKADGISWVAIRVSGPNADRTEMIVDTRFEANYAGAGAVGLPRLGYHGLHPDFVGQSTLFTKTVGGRPLELGYYGDLENLALSDAKCSAFLTAVDTNLLARGITHKCGVYTNLNFMNSHSGYWAEGRDLWIAGWVEGYNDSMTPIIPSPFDGWQFWQYSNQGYLDGVEKRVCLDVYHGTEAELYETYGIDEEDSMEVAVVDRNGNPIEGWTWETVQHDYGLSVTRADPPEGATVFRLVKVIFDASAETNFRMYAVDPDGVPLGGIAILMGIQPPSGEDLPDNTAPLLAEGVQGQPEGRPNRALILSPPELNFTNVDGYIQHSLGSGSNFIPPGPGSHWAWVIPGDLGFYTDVPAGFGMWDNHLMFWPVFQRTVVGDDGNGGDDPNDDLAEVLEQLVRIGDTLESIDLSLGIMSANWPFK